MNGRSLLGFHRQMTGNHQVCALFPPIWAIFFSLCGQLGGAPPFFFFFVIFIGFVEIHTPFCLLPLCHTSLLSISIWLNRRLGRERWGRVIGSVGELSWSYHISNQQRSRGSRWVKYYTTNLATDKEGASYALMYNHRTYLLEERLA